MIITQQKAKAGSRLIFYQQALQTINVIQIVSFNSLKGTIEQLHNWMDTALPVYEYR